MAYCTQDDLVARFGQTELLAIADRDGDDAIDTAVVSAALEAAANTIDSYIGARYALPLATTPPVLKTLCADLARQALYTTERPKIVDDNAARAMAILKDISRGVASLDAPAPPAADASQTGNEILFDSGDRRVSRAELRKL
jgi:phage gp36-like protein